MTCRWRGAGQEFGKVGLLGMHLEGYGCAGMSAVDYGLACLELEASDSGIRSLVSVQGSLAMFAIWRFGSEEQKQEWLPRMASGEAIGCFGLTEPDHGSDPGSMRTRARRDGDDWVLNGSKTWITNGSIADVAVVWANAGEEDGGIRGFVVPTDTPGFAAHTITHKMSLRASVTSELTFENLRLPADAVLPDVTGLKGPLACLSEARYGIVWGSLGAARSSLDAARRYSMERIQFGRPIAGFQLTQAKLANMATELQLGQLLALHLGAARTPSGCAPSRCRSASTTTSPSPSRSAAPRGRSSGPTASAASTPSCGTPTTSSRCSPTRAPSRCTPSSSARRSPASPPSADSTESPSCCPPTPRSSACPGRALHRRHGAGAHRRGDVRRGGHRHAQRASGVLRARRGRLGRRGRRARRGGPVIGRLVDKHGQRQVALPFVLFSTACGIVVVLLSWRGAPSWTLFLFYGLSAVLPEPGPMSRARWAHIYRDEPGRLHTAMSFEQVADEASFVLGPVLAVLVSTLWFPRPGCSSPSSSSPPGCWPSWRPARRSRRWSRTPSVPVAWPCAARAARRDTALVMTGVIFGANEVIAVAYARDHGETGFSSVILGGFALGSTLAGIVFGSRVFRSTMTRRLVIAATGMFLLEVPALLVDGLWPLAVVMFVAGSATAPLLITSLSLAQRLVPAALITEGMAVAITGILIGISAGSAVGGWAIEAWGAQPAYAVPVLAGALALAIIAVRYRHLERHEPAALNRSADPGPAASPPDPRRLRCTRSRPARSTPRR